MYCHQWGYLFRGDSTWDLDPLSDKHNTLSRKCPYQCQYNVKLELFWCTKALCRAQEFKEKRTRHRDFVLLLNSCFRMRDLKEEWGKMPLNLYGAAGERKELFWSNMSMVGFLAYKCHGHSQGWGLRFPYWKHVPTIVEWTREARKEVMQKWMKTLLSYHRVIFFSCVWDCHEWSTARMEEAAKSSVMLSFFFEW